MIIYCFSVFVFGAITGNQKGRTQGKTTETKMAAIIRLALGVVLCFPGCLTINVIEVNIPLTAKKGDTVAKCGCSDFECSVSNNQNSEGFEISKTGNIILTKDAVNFEQQIHPVLVYIQGNCYLNMDREQNFVFNFVDFASTMSMHKHILRSSMLNDSPALVGTVASLSPVASENDQIQAFNLLGPWSEYFKVKVNNVNEVMIVKEPKFLQNESFATLLFILEIKSEELIQYYNIEVFIGFDIEDSEDRYLDEEQESHLVQKRQISTIVPTNVLKNISVYENNTGVLFNIQEGQQPANRLSFEITKTTPEDIFLILEDGNVTLKEGSYLDYDKGHRMFEIHIEAKSPSQGGHNAVLLEAVLVDIFFIEIIYFNFLQIPSQTLVCSYISLQIQVYI